MGRQIHEDWPVYEVKAEDGSGRNRVLHRNLLFQCEGLPRDGPAVETQADEEMENSEEQAMVMEDEQPDHTNHDLMGAVVDGNPGEDTVEEAQDQERPSETECEAERSNWTEEEDRDDERRLPRPKRRKKGRRIFTYDTLGEPHHRDCVAIKCSTNVGDDVFKRGESVIPTEIIGPPFELESTAQVEGTVTGTAASGWVWGCRSVETSVLPRPWPSDIQPLFYCNHRYLPQGYIWGPDRDPHRSRSPT